MSPLVSCFHKSCILEVLFLFQAWQLQDFQIVTWQFYTILHYILYPVYPNKTDISTRQCIATALISDQWSQPPKTLPQWGIPIALAVSSENEQEMQKEELKQKSDLFEDDVILTRAQQIALQVYHVHAVCAESPGAGSPSAGTFSAASSIARNTCFTTTSSYCN